MNKLLDLVEHDEQGHSRGLFDFEALETGLAIGILWIVPQDIDVDLSIQWRPGMTPRPANPGQTIQLSRPRSAEFWSS